MDELRPEMSLFHPERCPDPGVAFEKDSGAAIDLDPTFPRSRVLCPRAFELEDGAYKLLFMEYGRFCPTGVNGVIVSASSRDGMTWERDGKICVGPNPPFATHRTLAPDVVRLPDGRFRMYFEGRSGNHSDVILSALSENGQSWTVEEGVRLHDGENRIDFGTPACVRLPGRKGWRLYHHARDPRRCEIWSAFSTDGLRWEREPGVRISQTRPEESYGAYSPHVIPTARGFWRMVYSGWCRHPEMRGRILAARSEDGLSWQKEADVVLEPGLELDAIHCSEPCLLRLANGRWRLFYEASDRKGRWRILGATNRM